MDILFNLLLFIHLVALTFAATAAIVMPFVAQTVMAGAPEGRALFGTLAKRFSVNSQAGLGILILSGLAMLFLRYGGFGGLSPWFHVKMTLIVAMIVVLVTGRLGKITPQIQVWATRILLLGIIFSAVMTFG